VDNDNDYSLSELHSEQLKLESRIYTLEKEAAFLSNILVLAGVIGIYFGLQWYVKNVQNIPGVQS
jgi:hypothetical protein